MSRRDLLSSMEIGSFFKSSSGRIAEFANMQTLLFRHNPSLQDYFMQIQLDAPSVRASRRNGRDPSSRLMAHLIRSADRAGRLGSRRKLKADVLFCPMPYFTRPAENLFLIRSLVALAETGARIVCLLANDAPCRAELDEQLGREGRTGQVEFIDPTSTAGAMAARITGRAAKIRGDAAFQEAVSILEPHGLRLNHDVRSGFEHIARFVEAWERLAPEVEFDAVVARCHWHALCSPVCRTARERGKPVITFQQGVIGHTLDVPVTATKYVAFGQASASFLDRMNKEFAASVGMPEPSVEFVKGGSLFDSLAELPDQFENQTLLMVDVPMAQADFYGTEIQCKALLLLAERLLTADLPLRRIVIRAHPFWSNLDFEDCQHLVRKHSRRCELSHPSWSLADDLRRSSVAVGIFSGALTVASAAGLPTLFLQTEDGYTTGDLSCFSPDQTLLPDAAFCEISRILAVPSEYANARALALRNARQYYDEGKNANLSGAFFEHLLEKRTKSHLPAESMK